MRMKYAMEFGRRRRPCCARSRRSCSRSGSAPVAGEHHEAAARRGALRARRSGPPDGRGETPRRSSPGTAVYVARGTPWSVEGDARAVSVLDPRAAEPSTGARRARPERGGDRRGDRRPPVPAPRDARSRVRLRDAVRRLHPAGRAPTTSTPTTRWSTCSKATAPARSAASRRRCDQARACTSPRGSCIASRTPVTGEMRVLGVFRPAGSPAEAYYPDGTPAVVENEES